MILMQRLVLVLTTGWGHGIVQRNGKTEAKYHIDQHRTYV